MVSSSPSGISCAAKSASRGTSEPDRTTWQDRFGAHEWLTKRPTLPRVLAVGKRHKGGRERNGVGEQRAKGDGPTLPRA
eukprot:scaffold34071_cov101-Isochrysis_galbana.AAC.1